MRATKACAVVLRGAPGATQILAFRHPLAGLQLVKGTINPNEDAAQAAVRELQEEAGLVTQSGAFLGVWASGYKNQVWSFHICHPITPPPEAWEHHCADDGGHLFSFFWHTLSEPPSNDWHPIFVGALEFVRGALQQTDVS